MAWLILKNYWIVKTSNEFSDETKLIKETWFLISDKSDSVLNSV